MYWILEDILSDYQGVGKSWSTHTNHSPAKTIVEQSILCMKSGQKDSRFKECLNEMLK